MTDVIDLGQRRRQREAEMKELWECTDCGAKEFLLTTDGSVICAGCRDLIEDLRVVDLDERQ